MIPFLKKKEEQKIEEKPIRTNRRVEILVLRSGFVERSYITPIIEKEGKEFVRIGKKEYELKEKISGATADLVLFDKDKDEIISLSKMKSEESIYTNQIIQNYIKTQIQKVEVEETGWLKKASDWAPVVIAVLYLLAVLFFTFTTHEVIGVPANATTTIPQIIGGGLPGIPHIGG